MKVTLGPQKRSRVIDEKDKLDTAIHESGHALISKLAKERVEKVEDVVSVGDPIKVKVIEIDSQNRVNMMRIVE